MKNKLETVDALQEWGRDLRDKGHPASLTLFRAAAVIMSDIQTQARLLEALSGIIDDCACDLPLWRVDEARAAISLASESQGIAAGTEALPLTNCSASWCCPTCGIAQPMPTLHPLGTRVKHAKHGKGKIFSYDQCDEVSCGVDFGRNGQWCIAMRELIILPNANVDLPGDVSHLPSEPFQNRIPDQP